MLELKYSSKKLIFLVLFVLLMCSMQVCAACTAVYVGPDVSEDNSTIIARTNDYPQVWGNHITVTPRVENEPGRLMPVSADGDIKTELPETTYKYTATPYMNSTTAANEEAVYDAAACTNEYGVAMTMSVTALPIGNALKADPLVEDGLCEDAATDLVICQSKTAREAVEVLLGIIDKYGSSESNIALIADQSEAWYVEMYTGHQYAAVKLPADKVSVFGNEYSLEYLSDFEDFITSKELISLAEENGFAVYGKNDEINLFETYSGFTLNYGHLRTWIGHQLLAPSKFSEDYNLYTMYPLCFTPDKKVSVQDVCQILRNRYEGTEYSPDETGRTDVYAIGNEIALSAHVIQVFPDLPAEMSCISWVSCGPQVYGVFVPISNDCINVSEAYGANQPADDMGVFDTDKYPYYLFKELCTRCIGPDNYKIYGQPVQKYWYNFESNMFAGMSEVLAQAAKMEDNNARTIYITSYCNAMQTKAFEEGKRILKNLTPEVPPATIIAEDLASNCTEIEYGATLKDNNGIGIANKTLIFEVNGKSYSGITNSKGIATVFLTLPNGNYSINVSFKGDDKVGKKTAHATITINSINTGDLPVPEIERDYEKWQKFDFPLASNAIVPANESVILTNNQTSNTSNSYENSTIARNMNLNGIEYIIALISVVATGIIAAIFIKKYKY